MCGQFPVLKRVNYFSGQLLTAEDLGAEQEYHRERWRRHNRCLHGWGLVCGLEVSVGGEEITIASGLALDCRGDEVILPTPSTLHPPCGSPGTATLYVLISPCEEPADPVPLGDDATAYSRMMEGSRLVLGPEDPTAGHVRRQGHKQPCGISHGVPLARLRWVRKQWRMDPRYRRYSAH